MTRLKTQYYRFYGAPARSIMAWHAIEAPNEIEAKRLLVSMDWVIGQFEIRPIEEHTARVIGMIPYWPKCKWCGLYLYWVDLNDDGGLWKVVEHGKRGNACIEGCEHEPIGTV